MKKQQFKMCKPLTSSVQEYIDRAKQSNDEGYLNDVISDMQDESLVLPVTTVEFDYPYYGRRIRHFAFPRNQYPTTKRELLEALRVHLTEYLEKHPYDAPHGIDDFCVEILDVTPFNDSYASVYVTLGS